MIYLIIKAILPFIFILVFSVFAISTIFWIIYYDELHQFNSIEMSFRTIFDFTIGNVDFGIFNDETGLGMWLTIIWVFISTISLLNIMIALLSSEFEDVISSTNAYYIQFIHNIWVYNGYTSGYGGITSLSTPLNCLLIIFTPLYRMNLK